jgi:hypothetical protein
LFRFIPSAPHVLAGAVAFAAAQAGLFLVAGEGARPTIDGNGWFLNSLAGISVMAIVAAAVRTVALRTWPTSSVWKGWMAYVAGAAGALITVVFALGPGTIFPIVIAAGVVVVGVGALAGSAVARLIVRRQRIR